MGRDRIRVCIVINSLAPYGAENFVLNHVRHANRDRFEVTVVHLGGPTTLIDKMRAAGAEVVNVSRGRPRYTPMVLVRLARELKRRRIDVVQTHIGVATVVGRLAAGATGVPVVTTEQTIRTDYAPWLVGLQDLTYRMSARHVFITQAVMRSYAERFPWVARDPVVITNGIDVDAVARVAAEGRDSARRELGISPATSAFVNVARLNPKKGQSYALEALALLRKNRADAELWIVGEGPLREELAAQARTLGVQDALHLVGERLDVHHILGAFDACIHPSTTEGLGIAILEAMAAGLPTMASAVDGIPELIEDGQTGWLVPPRDPRALAARMEAVLADPGGARVVAERGRAAVRREHDVRDAVARYERLYEELLAG